MIKRFFHSITHAPFKIVKETIVALGIVLSLYQLTVIFFPSISKCLIGWKAFLVFIFISIVYGFLKARKVSKVNFIIPHTNTTVEVLFGDLFKQDGLRVIPVNNFFDSEIGIPVSPKTLHGIMIENHLNGRNFDAIVGEQLASVKSQTVKKTRGKQKRYPIGTTATIKTDGDYLLFALSKTDPTTCKAHCDVATMWFALEQLLNRGRIESNGYPVNLPLVGSGQSGVGLRARDLLNLLLLSIVTATKSRRIAGKIRIILKYDLFQELDLKSIKQHWKE